MYEHFYNFSKKPFDLTPNPGFLYLSRSHKKALTYLNYALKEKAGFILLTGEVGAGKTTLIKDFINKLDGNIAVSKVFNTKVNAVQLLSLINYDFGLDVEGKDKVALLKDLNDFLIAEFEKGRRGLLIIDEAQNLTPELLEEVRLLSNLETGEARLLQIILAGQPELGKTLSLFELRQLRQRISIACHISPLSRGETEEYIMHRLEVAGNREAVNFSRAAMDAIYVHSKGIPRIVNIICNFLLLTAYTEETREVTAEMVCDIVQDLSIEAQSAGRDDSEIGKRALLSALGASAKYGGTDSGNADGDSRQSRERRLGFLLKEINLRLGAMEKDLSKLRSVDLTDIAGRLDRLEGERAHDGIEDDRGDPSSGSSREIAAVGTGMIAAGVKNSEEQDPPRPGLLRRIFGVG